MSDIDEDDLLKARKVFEEGGKPSMVAEPLVNWNAPCSACGNLPTVANTGLCGPCCFGEADALDWFRD